MYFMVQQVCLSVSRPADLTMIIFDRAYLSHFSENKWSDQEMIVGQEPR